MKYDHERFVRAKRTVALVAISSITIEQAIRLAQDTLGGTAFDAKLKEKDDQIVWRVKLLTAEGRKKIYIDGRTGSVIEAKAEHLFEEPVSSTSP